MKRALFLLVTLLSTLAWTWVFTHPANPPPSPPSPAFVIGFSLFLGLCCGVVVALVAMVLRALVAARPELPLEDGERALVSVPANHWRGVEARGGRLFLTTQAAVFVPHRFNFQREVLRAELDGLVSLGAAPTELELRLEDGRAERLRVDQGEALADQLLQLIAASPGERARAAQTGLVRAPWLLVEGDPRELQA